MKVRTDIPSDVLTTNRNILIYLIKHLVLFLASLKILLEHRREGMDLLINSLINISWYILSLFGGFLLNLLCKPFLKVKKKLVKIKLFHEMLLFI